MNTLFNKLNGKLWWKVPQPQHSQEIINLVKSLNEKLWGKYNLVKYETDKNQFRLVEIKPTQIIGEFISIPHSKWYSEKEFKSYLQTMVDSII